MLDVSRGYDLFVSPFFLGWLIYAVFCVWVTCGLMVFGFLRRWQRWITQCDNVYVTQCARLFCFFRFARVQSHQNRFFFISRYPHDIPPGTAVPQWAFYNVTTLPDQTYSDTVAMSVGRKSFSSPSFPLVVVLDAGVVVG